MVTMNTIYIDMDGVICDYINPAKKFIKDNPRIRFPQSQYGFFIDLPEIKNAIKSYKFLDEHFDVCILTRPSVQNISCYSEKAYWVRKYLGRKAQEKMIFSCDKSRVKGHFLIDDTITAKQEQFEGKLIRFGSKEFPDWKTIINYFIKQFKLTKSKNK